MESPEMNIWSNPKRDIVSKSSREEDDDKEASKRPHTQTHPTFLLLSQEKGHARKVDLQRLGAAERKLALERQMKWTPKEGCNENFLLKLKERIQRVGIQLPKIEVRFEHLNVQAEAYVASRAMPSMFNFFMNNVEGFLSYLRIIPNKKKQFSVLHEASGIIKPGRMTLLLGPPSSGKTTLLLALAGRLSSDLKVSGKITYNGHETSEFVPQRSSAYISQHDLHMGELTVRETIAFSSRFQGVGAFHDMLMELPRREKEANITPDPDLDIILKAMAIEGEINVVTNYIIKILGLEACADTRVGDHMMRGISGGEKKRLTTGEMMVGPARVFLMDSISTGLDSSTTFQIVNSIKQSIHILEGTAVMSLLQPSPETYELFDDLILLSDGYIVYQGPREDVLEFFESMGFYCPENKAVADFLQEVTSKKDQEQYLSTRNKPYVYVSAKEFSDAFRSFHVGKNLAAELSVPFDKSKNHPTALTTKKYGVSTKELLKACISRELLLMKRNSFVYAFLLIKNILMALIAVTVFLRPKMHKDSAIDGQIFMAAIFVSVGVIMFNGFTDLALSVVKLPVFYKQRDLLFFPAWAYALPTWILKIPYTVLETGVWVSISYYTMGFDPYVGRFWTQYLLLMLIHQMSSGLFRLVASLGREMMVAVTFGTFAYAVFLLLGGFLLQYEEINKWFRWGYWMSPLMYAQNSVSVNEFLGHSWAHHFPIGSTEPLGVSVLKSHGIFAEARWTWIGATALVAFTFLFNFLYTISLTFLKPLQKPQAAISEESSPERRSSYKTGEAVELSSRGKDLSESQDFNRRRTSSGCLSSSVARTCEHETNEKRGMVLPFQPLSVTFDGIRYAIDMPQEMKARGLTNDRFELLKGVSGSFRPGVLTALMGVTGAGKTTLMDVLSGRKTGGYIEGTITISGYPKKQETFARIAGYCEQTDIHSPHVTVYESLYYSAWLRLQSEVDLATRKMFVEEVMELVELSPIREALVGLPGVNGLSAEQRKRLTIAVELVANPSIIFMDEPTTGLDARAAAIVMRAIRNTGDTGRTVVCTIHQPSYDIFNAFDELLLLKLGGEEIYVGPLGSQCSQLIKYFEGTDGVAKIRDGYNPATWMLEVSSISQEVAVGVNFAALYRSSEAYKRNKALIKELSTPAPGSQDLRFPTPYSQTFSNQFMACLWKHHLSYWRNTEYNVVRLLYTMAMTLVTGSIFWQRGSKWKRVQDLFNAMGSMYLVLLFVGTGNAGSVQPVVALERTVFCRERAARMYSALPYALGQIVIELPYILVQTVVYAVLVYAMMGFEWTASKLLWYILISYFTLLYFTAFGMMTAAITPNFEIAAAISSFVYSTWNIFSGFLVPKPRIPIWWRWNYYCCPIAWTLYGLVVSQFGDIKEEMIDTDATVEDFIRKYFGFKHDFLPYVALIIVGTAVLFTLIFAFSIKTLNFQKR